MKTLYECLIFHEMIYDLNNLFRSDKFTIMHKPNFNYKNDKHYETLTYVPKDIFCPCFNHKTDMAIIKIKYIYFVYQKKYLI